MNNCTFSGNLVRDPEARSFQSGSKKVSGTIAVNNRRKNAEGVWEASPAFLDIYAWGPTGDRLEKLTQGAFVEVEFAQVEQENWEKEGQKRSKLIFRVERLGMTRPKGGKQGEDNDNAPPAKRGRPSKKATPEPEPAFAGNDEELPF